MPHFTIKPPDGMAKTFNILKRISSIGSGPENDIVLHDKQAAATAMHVSFDGHRYRLVAVETPFLLNGKKRTEHILQENDSILVGQTELVFGLAAAPLAQPGLSSTNAEMTGVDPYAQTSEVPGVPGRELAALRRLTAFSEKLLQSYTLDNILANLMDEVIDVTRADKGFLILLESNELRVKVARNLARENIERAVEKVSDSIVAKVVQTRKPLIVADAFDDPEFNASSSVVNLKLLSVMCTPLMHKGDLFGLIYVGNDRLANRFEQKSLDTLMVFSAQASLLIHNALLVNELRLDNVELRQRLETQQYGDIIGSCASMNEVFKRIDKIAPTDISVLITGETGTGKELIAQEIHRRSLRSKGPFITINCGAIPENLLESELFGHTKGAFTGAVSTRPGKFQAAIGGTLFLDEIGEMPLQLQVKLLRAIQEKIVYKVGDTRGEPVDIRIVAATNKVLEQEVKKNTFREDLYFRLNVVTIALPPLRTRGHDLIAIAKFFLQKFSIELKTPAKGFSPSATLAMKKYAWPGNIRELENRIKKAVVLADKPLLTPDDLDLKPENLEPIMSLAQAKEEFQKRYIDEVLERNNGNRTKTAKDLGVDPRTIFRHLEKRDEGDSTPGATESNEEL